MYNKAITFFGNVSGYTYYGFLDMQKQNKSYLKMGKENHNKPCYCFNINSIRLEILSENDNSQ